MWWTAYSGMSQTRPKLRSRGENQQLIRTRRKKIQTRTKPPALKSCSQRRGHVLGFKQQHKKSKFGNGGHEVENRVATTHILKARWPTGRFPYSSRATPTTPVKTAGALSVRRVGGAVSGSRIPFGRI